MIENKIHLAIGKFLSGLGLEPADGGVSFSFYGSRSGRDKVLIWEDCVHVTKTTWNKQTIIYVGDPDLFRKLTNVLVPE